MRNRAPQYQSTQPEIKVRLRQPLRVRGIIWARGLIIPLPKSDAQRLIRMEVAELVPPEALTAVEQQSA